MSKQTLEYEVPEVRYKPDLELLQRYHDFSEEILRLALVLLAGYGFLLKEVALHEKLGASFFDRLCNAKWVLVVGLVAIGLAAAGALSHRYFSTDGFEHEIRYLRLTAAADGEHDEALDRLRLRVYERMKCWFKTAWWSLRIGVGALATAAVAVAAAFIATLFG